MRHENLHGGTKAACSVACLERLWWITEQRTVTKGSRKPPRSLCETTTAKEARKEPRLPRKAPRPVSYTHLLALIVLISIGVITDVIGTAVTSADEQPFIAMASKRIRGAKQALQLIRKAERVSSLLNDVVGDIVGVVSGSAGSVIALYLDVYKRQAYG